ncbi:PIN domain-containing protein [Candidatus Micrarchaeota archaeon]|nr:PIN domain-containing protein [Candidatus Micrarchaeota archaeon]MBU1165335.1 PIN domain-containing protein [Candidatus Micrarchaeota archaeon]MBU1886985.1 PIN domain-containing protein [Candidatus Micrarchaeota archaeon]
MIESKLLDTNILVYAFDTSDKVKHGIAKKLLETCISRKEQFYISTQNISEFYHVITKYVENPLPKSEARVICEKFICFSGFVKLSPTSYALLGAMKIDEKFKVGYWDALIAATMIENGINTIITENKKDFQKIPGVIILDPFSK